MEVFIDRISSSIGITDVLDILIVAFLIYKVLGFIRETRAEQLAKGLLVLIVITMLSDVLHLYTLRWLLSGLMTVGLVAIVVIFQPELRRGLEYLGRSRISNVFGEVDKEEAKHIVGEFVEAIEAMSSSKTGALLVIERETALNDIVETGTIINADISAQMIGTIFYEGTPLHDGAVIVRGDPALCGRMCTAADAEQRIEQRAGNAPPRGYRHYGELRCTGDHRFGGDGGHLHCTER